MRKSLQFALSLLGLFDSAYLWWVYTSPSRPMVCLGSGCDEVRASSYANLWGLPLPVYGVVMYAALALLIFAAPLASEGLARTIRYAVAGISGAGFLFSLYLMGISEFVLHAWCAWCVVSALAVTCIFALAVLELTRPVPHPEPLAALATARRHFAVFVMALLVSAPAFFFLSRHGELPPVQLASPQTLLERLVRPDSHLTGNPQATVTVVEFADFQCTACGRTDPAFREIRRKYADRVRFVFRHFPQERIHPQAEKAAEASECAAEQGKFWEAAEKFYDRQNDLRVPALERYASELGLDQNRFRQCLSSGSMAARVRRDAEDARALGLYATPTFVVGQQAIMGQIEFAAFARVIDQELARQGVAVAESRSPTGSPQGGAPPPAKSPSAASRPAANPSRTPGILSQSGTGIFTQFQSSATACRDDQASQQQPILIRTPEARQFFEGSIKAVFVDVRPAGDFRRGRIPGAINVPVEEMERRWSQLPKDRTLVLYESGRSPGDVCGSSRAAGRVLLTQGFTPELVKVYQDGLEGWEKAGLPIER